MKEARMLGFRVGKYADESNVSTFELSEVANCSETQMRAFLKGRVFMSFDQLSAMAKRLGVAVSALLSGRENEYNLSVVHCMNEFEDSQNREKILDIIDEYMDLLDSIS